MPRFEVKQSDKLNLSFYSGLALTGQCCQAAQVDAVIDSRLPRSQGIKSSNLVQSIVGLVRLGKSDFEAIEPSCDDRLFMQPPVISKGYLADHQQLQQFRGSQRIQQAHQVKHSLSLQPDFRKFVTGHAQPPARRSQSTASAAASFSNQNVLPLLMRFGSHEYDKRGARLVYLAHKSRQRPRRTLGAKTYGRLEPGLNVYAVVDTDGAVLTVGHRPHRINRN